MRTIKRHIVGAFIFSSDNKLLLGKSLGGGVYEGAWIVPGGGIEPNETKDEAVTREILEETGLDISNAEVELLDKTLGGESEKTLRDTGERVLVDMVFYNYVVRFANPASELKPSAEDDFIDAKWFPVSDLKTLELSPPTAQTLRILKLL